MRRSRISEAARLVKDIRSTVTAPYTSLNAEKLVSAGDQVFFAAKVVVYR